MWGFGGKEEDVEDFVEANEFCNIILLVRLIHRIRRCHFPEWCCPSLTGVGNCLVCGLG